MATGTEIDSKEAEAIAELLGSFRSGDIDSKVALESAKKNVAVTHGLARFLPNSDILAAMLPSERKKWDWLIRVHPRRSASGIIVITAFTAPASCPHGTCVFCPGGINWGTPQSYMPDGPGMRGARGVEFDPLKQARRSVSKYAKNGHDTGKVETIIEGGTFMALPTEYKERFVKGVYDGLNGCDSYSEGTLEEAQTRNETAESRCVGLTVESKPDWCEPEQIDEMLSYGVTRLEIGVQCLRDGVLKLSNRGHTVDDSVRASRAARDAGLKVAYHMMPGLPGASPAEDLVDLRRIFEEEQFKPDMLKLYPTLVVMGTALAKLYEAGRFKPYELEEVIDILAEMKRFVPPWLRIMRIQREIPIHEIVGGIRAGNLRELVLRKVAERGYKCNCIRCREVALSDPEELFEDDELAMRREDYAASGGGEVFLSYEFRKTGRIAGFLRLRRPSDKAYRREVGGSCIVREVKVYGRAISIGRRDARAWQHRGLGASMLAEAERITAEEFDARKVLVTSAVGTRMYYRKFGYEREGPYMSKMLTH